MKFKFNETELITFLDEFETFSKKYADLKAAIILKKQQVSDLETKLYKELREKAENEGKRVTEKLLENQLKNHPELIKLKKEYINLLAEEKYLDAEKEVFYMKRFVLDSLGKLKEIEVKK